MSRVFLFSEITGIVEGYTNKAQGVLGIFLKHNAMSPTNQANTQIEWIFFQMHF